MKKWLWNNNKAERVKKNNKDIGSDVVKARGGKAPRSQLLGASLDLNPALGLKVQTFGL